jgi:outer membrane murein-binding lipoprotein Lpp
MEKPVVTPEFLRRKIDEIEKIAGGGPLPARPIDGGDEPPHLSAMRERLARLEGAFDWLKITLALLAAVVIGGFAFLGVQSNRIDGKVGSLSDQVAALPGQINSNLRDLTKTLSEAILAAKQPPPQVILMPAPQLPQSPPPPAKPP